MPGSITMRSAQSFMTILDGLIVRNDPSIRSDNFPFPGKTACARRIGYFADSAQAKMTSRNVRTSALDSMSAPIVAEKLILGRLADAVGRQRIDDASDIEE